MSDDGEDFEVDNDEEAYPTDVRILRELVKLRDQVEQLQETLRHISNNLAQMAKVASSISEDLDVRVRVDDDNSRNITDRGS